MKSNYSTEGNVIKNICDDDSRIIPVLKIQKSIHEYNNEMIRFEERRERFVWIHPCDIIFLISADHYVKALVNLGKQKKWMSRHCTIKELVTILPASNFVRLNRFYLLNKDYFSHIDHKEKTLHLVDSFCIPVSHRISPFILDIIKK